MSRHARENPEQYAGYKPVDPKEREDDGCNCDDQGKGQYHLKGCRLYVEPKVECRLEEESEKFKAFP